MQVLTYGGRPLDYGYAVGNMSVAPKTFTNAPSSFSASYIWTDGTDIFYSTGSTQLVYNKNTSTWSTKTWSGTTTIPERTGFVKNLWYYTSGTRRYNYYSGGSSYYQYYLNGSSWNSTAQQLSSMSGEYVWHDGNNVYYSAGTTHKYFDTNGSGWWDDKTWNGLSNFSGDEIWTDGTTIYCYHNKTHYVLNRSTSTWSVKTWNGFSSVTSFYVKDIWHHGSDTFYSNGTNHYKLNPSTSTWTVVSFGANFSGRDVWSDGTNWYVGARYVILFNTTNSRYSFIYYEAPGSGYSWTQKFNNDSLSATDIYGDGTNYFCSFDDVQLKLNTTNDTWENWGGFRNTDNGTQFYPYVGRDVWKFQGNFYYSHESNHYFLNLSSKTARAREWPGLSAFDGQFTWSDGDELVKYQSSSIYGNQKLLLYSDYYRWISKTWTGLATPTGTHVWRDFSGNVYYSSGTTHYVLNKSTSTWTAKTWYGLTSFSGNYVWTDNTKIFVTDSNGATYELDARSSTWNQITIGGPTVRPQGRYVYWYKGYLCYGKYRLVQS